MISPIAMRNQMMVLFNSVVHLQDLTLPAKIMHNAIWRCCQQKEESLDPEGLQLYSIDPEGSSSLQSGLELMPWVT